MAVSYISSGRVVCITRQQSAPFISRLLKQIFLFLFLFSFLHIRANAQDSLLIHYLVKRIAAQQINQDPFFLKGIFPSYISNRASFKQQTKDNNIFYNGLILYTLHDIYPDLSAENKLICDTIKARNLPLLHRFKNKNGRNTYNFWRTDSAFRFPYTKWISILRGPVTLPDDMDDTVLSLMAQNAPDSTAERVHKLMQLYVNSDTSKVRSSNRKFRNIPAYSTWFGKNFPVVFDIVVLSNVLAFVQTYDLQWSKADSASLQLIVTAIKQKDHVRQPQYISPYYGRTSIILYHLARLMSIKKIPELEALKPVLIADAMQIWMDTDNILEKIILSTSILKWGYTPPEISLPQIADLEKIIEQNDLPFFIGNIPSYFPHALKKAFVKKGLGLFYHYCPAYNNALLLEYLVLRRENVKGER